MEARPTSWSLLIIIGCRRSLLMLIANRVLQLSREEARGRGRLAAEKAAQYAARIDELEQRVRVLEQIVTDSGAQTAAQIEALRAAGAGSPASVEAATRRA